ncbi:MAG: hypothetical protein Q9212_004315 [Teloschistes hypoglaucus]
MLCLTDACNAKGVWGKGVAAAFKEYSPSAFEYYRHYCTHSQDPIRSLVEHQRALVGTCLLIDPYSHDFSNKEHLYRPPSPGHKDSRTYSKPTTIEEEKRFWIACLFTSNDYGRKVDPPELVLKATAAALHSLDRRINHYEGMLKQKTSLLDEVKSVSKDIAETDSDSVLAREVRCHKLLVERAEIGRCYAVRINSGLFGIPWEMTKNVLIKGKVNMVVVSPPDEGGDTKATIQGQTSNGKKKDSTDELKREIQSIKAEMKMMKDHISTMKEDMDRLKDGQDSRTPGRTHGTKRKIDVIDVDDDKSTPKKEEPNVKLERNGS